MVAVGLSESNQNGPQNPAPQQQWHKRLRGSKWNDREMLFVYITIMCEHCGLLLLLLLSIVCWPTQIVCLSPIVSAACAFCLKRNPASIVVNGRAQEYSAFSFFLRCSRETLLAFFLYIVTQKNEPTIDNWQILFIENIVLARAFSSIHLMQRTKMTLMILSFGNQFIKFLSVVPWLPLFVSVFLSFNHPLHFSCKKLKKKKPTWIPAEPPSRQDDVKTINQLCLPDITYISVSTSTCSNVLRSKVYCRWRCNVTGECRLSHDHFTQKGKPKRPPGTPPVVHFIFISSRMFYVWRSLGAKHIQYNTLCMWIWPFRGSGRASWETNDPAKVQSMLGQTRKNVATAMQSAGFYWFRFRWSSFSVFVYLLWVVDRRIAHTVGWWMKRTKIGFQRNFDSWNFGVKQSWLIK